MSDKKDPPHFKGKDPLEHVIEAKKVGMQETMELHGTELSGTLSAFTDALRDTTLALVLFWIVTLFLQAPVHQELQSMLFLGLGWIFWKGGRSAWLGWSRLERLHRIVLQEQYEIEHHRDQERLELKELYRAKGFEEPLLDEVVEVLMSDGDRLLKVMVEEELGLSLENQDHPLKQALFAVLGSLTSLTVTYMLLYWFPAWGPFLALFLLLSLAGFMTAHFNGNHKIPAVVWHVALGAVACGLTYFCIEGFL